MINRYDSKVLKKSIFVKLISGIILIILSIVGLIFIENNEKFNKLYIQIILVFIFIAGLAIFVSIAKNLRKLDIEKNHKQIEKYILECDSYISTLYQMHLNNDLITKLSEKNIQLFSNYPIVYEDEYVIEIIRDDKKLIIQFYEKIIKYAIVKIDKYEFEINEAKWNKINNFNFNSKEQIIEFISNVYNNIA